jgi:CRP-like cAMP-binding protein
MESMSHFEPLITHINKRVPITDAEAAEIIAAFKLTQIKKRQFIIQPDFIAKYRNYILKGAFRGYVVAENGQDHTIQLAVDDWWISDYNSYIFQKPASMFVVALEDGIILQLSQENEQKLKLANPKFETFFRIMAERTAAYFQRRIISALTLTAEERYEEFVNRYPVLVQRIPQYAIASYLGMSTEFLSKIRHNKVRKKS